jgi:hypothetical protein
MVEGWEVGVGGWAFVFFFFFFFFFGLRGGKRGFAALFGVRVMVWGEKRRILGGFNCWILRKNAD